MRLGDQVSLRALAAVRTPGLSHTEAGALEEAAHTAALM
jgi:hypothetical protein